MRYNFLLPVALFALICLLVSSSCKKTTHPTLPTPANYRLLSYNKVSNYAYPVTENYSFSYDANNRVSTILYATNDTSGGVVGKRMVFTYYNDSIIKTITNVKTKKLLEIDTFVTNAQGQITSVFMPGISYTYQYYGKLISSSTVTYLDTNKLYKDGTTVSAVTTYTSDNSDLLTHDYNDNLTATFTNLIPPLVVTWNVDYGITSVVHGTGSSTDVLNGYDRIPLTVVAKDVNGISDTGQFPGLIWNKESYYVYPDKTNGIGDYLGLNSFTVYGFNFYQNAHLIKQIVSSGYNRNLSYTIDNESKVTQTVLTVIDSIGFTHTEIYNIQYETY